MAEDLTSYLQGAGIRVRYMHHDVDTIERMEIIRDLRLGTFDVLVGINLLREGLDLPEVSLVAILDADKEGFLRSETSLIQTIGRAARNAQGLVILYADRVTPSMAAAMEETQRRREIQNAYNQAHGIVPKTIVKSVRDLIEISHAADGKERKERGPRPSPPKEKASLIAQLEQEMKGGQPPAGVRVRCHSAGSNHRIEGGQRDRLTPEGGFSMSMQYHCCLFDPVSPGASLAGSLCLSPASTGILD